MQTIDREPLQLKLGNTDDLILVEVLFKDSADDSHIPGAMNVSLKPDDFAGRVQAVVNKDDEHVVYCQNTECDASPRAAYTMRKLGLKRVFDHEAGKDDWRVAGLPAA